MGRQAGQHVRAGVVFQWPYVCGDVQLMGTACQTLPNCRHAHKGSMGMRTLRHKEREKEDHQHFWP